MDISCSPLALVTPRYPAQGILDIADAGFQNLSLDINLCCSPSELKRWGKQLPQNASQDSGSRRIMEDPAALGDCFAGILEACRKEHLRISIARGCFLPRDTRRGDLSELLTQINEESIRLCGKTGCRHLVVRPLFAGVPRGELWEANRAYYLRLARAAKKNQVMLLLENQCRDFNGHLIRGCCAESGEAVAWIDRLNEAVGEELFGFCMDVGVCSLCGLGMRDFVLALGNRLKAVVLRDCDGNQETAQLPFTCIGSGGPQTDWLNLIRGLREAGFDGQLILDFSDTAAAFSPLLRPQLMQLAKATADYFQWQIGIENILKKYPSRVLFGAGNMCRNYMKCYGEKYPPLFTCANNPASWGTEFCGLEVKPPESLRELPEDCAVFICNIYYREIEEQLREMGIRNPVEYFNDEYMPAFHFDRLKER